MSLQDFKNQTNGKAFNIDFAWGAQCWDGYAKYCQYLGVPYANCTVTGYVRDIWEQRHSNGTLKYFDEVSTMEVGDIVVFKPEGMTPVSHIAIFAGDAGGGYGWFYGQNQGGTPDGQGGKAFNTAKFPYSLTYPTAFRLKGSKQVQPSVQSNGFVKNERGTFTVTVDKLNVRNAPSTSSGVESVYSKGQTFTYDSVYEINGYRWVSYVSYSGVRRYVSYRKIGGEKYGTVA